MTQAPSLSTARTILRPMTAADSECVFAYRSDVETNKYQGFLPKTVKEAEEWIARRPEEFNKANTWYQLAIVEQTTGDILGDVGIHFIGEHNLQCELGCTIRKQNLQQGYATEALRAVCHYLFTNLKKHRLEANILHPNVASIKLFEKVGFVREGYLKKAYLHDREWLDTVIYSLLGGDWVENVSQNNLSSAIITPAI